MQRRRDDNENKICTFEVQNAVFRKNATTINSLPSPQRSSWALRGPKLETELKMSFPGPSGPGAQKSQKQSRKRVKKWKFQLFFNFFDSFSTPFSTFWTRGRKGPGTHFQLRFQLWARRAKNSSGGWKGRKPRQSIFESANFIVEKFCCQLRRLLDFCPSSNVLVLSSERVNGGLQ